MSHSLGEARPLLSRGTLSFPLPLHVYEHCGKGGEVILLNRVHTPLFLPLLAAKNSAHPLHLTPSPLGTPELPGGA